MRPASEEQWRRLAADVGRLVGRRVPPGADVEDVVQDVLLRVWRHGGDLRDEERFGGWLSRIAYTAAADHLRARRRHPLPRHEPDEASAPVELPAEPGPTEARALIIAVLRPFVEQLPPPYREAVELSELEELSHATIASRLGLSVTAVKSRVHRGRTHLREMLERCCEFALDARGGPTTCDPRPDGVVPAGCCGNDCGAHAKA